MAPTGQVAALCALLAIAAGARGAGVQLPMAGCGEKLSQGHTAPVAQKAEVRGCGLPVETQRIVFGDVAHRGELPWQAALVYEKDGVQSVRCGGALVHPRFVLTAAHCVHNATVKGHRLVEVRLGLVDCRVVDARAVALRVIVASAHPHFAPGVAAGVRNAHDIALLLLHAPAPYTEYIRTLCLPTVDHASTNVTEPINFMVAGWGITEYGNYSDQLRVAIVPPVDSIQCATKLGVTIAETQLCAGSAKSDSCIGDSGGPLIRATISSKGDMIYEVVGLVSFGPNVCASNESPGCYTKVASYLHWIHEVIDQQL